MSWDNLEEAFKDLDAKEFSFFATALSAYRKALMKEGFTRRETSRLVESYAKFLYEMSIEDFIAQKRQEEDNLVDEEIDDDDDDEFGDVADPDGPEL